MDESHYRKQVQATLDRVEKAFDDVDPDLAECSQSLGALTIQFPKGARCILSVQPSVRQLWLAVAARGTAFHFNWDASANAWKDDKGKGIELLSYLSTYLKEETGQSFQF